MTQTQTQNPSIEVPAKNKPTYAINKGSQLVQTLAELDSIMGTSGMRALLDAADDSDTFDRLMELIAALQSVNPSASVPNPSDKSETWKPTEYLQSILNGRTDRSKRAAQNHKDATKAYKASLRIK